MSQNVKYRTKLNVFSQKELSLLLKGTVEATYKKGDVIIQVRYDFSFMIELRVDSPSSSKVRS